MLRQDLTAIETKSLTEDKDREIATFSGVASTADKDLTDDIICEGAFGEINPTKIRMFRDHQSSKVIGKWRRFVQNGKRLEVEGEIGLDIPIGLETYKLMKHGYIDGLSVGFIPHRKGVKYDDENDVRLIQKATLLECSIVAIPANSDARLHSVKSFTRDDWLQWLIDCGLPPRHLETVMTRGFDALLRKQNDEGEPPEPKENESRETYMSRCMRAGNEMAACAEAWKESQDGEENGNGKSKRKRINISEIDGYRDISESEFAALATEAKRLGELLRGKQS